MPTNEACVRQLLQYAKVKEEECAAESETDIINYRNNGSECPSRISDMLFFTGKLFDENFESGITKKDIQKMIIVNIDIVPILFTLKRI